MQHTTASSLRIHAIWDIGRRLNRYAHEQQRRWIDGQPPCNDQRQSAIADLTSLIKIYTKDPALRDRLLETLHWPRADQRSDEQRSQAEESLAEQWTDLNWNCRQAFATGASVRAVLEDRQWLSDVNHLALESWAEPEFQHAFRSSLESDLDHYEARLFALAIAVDQLLHPVPLTDGLDWSWRPSADTPLYIPPVIVEDFGQLPLEHALRQSVLCDVRELGFQLQEHDQNLTWDDAVVTRSEFVVAVDKVLRSASDSTVPLSAVPDSSSSNETTDVCKCSRGVLKPAEAQLTAEKSSKLEVLKGLEEIRERGEPFTSQRQLARRFACAPSTVCEAIKLSSELQEWSAREPAMSLGLPSLGDIDVPDPFASDADDFLDVKDVDRAMSFLLEQAEPEERQRILAMEPAQRRKLAELAFEDRDRSDLIFDHSE